MPYCSKCGRRYDVDARFCSNCGKSLDVQHESMGSPGGKSKTLHKPERDKRCPYCDSTGEVEGPMSGSVVVPCPVCKGRRYNLIPEDWLKCRECGATGEFTYGAGNASVRKPCPECKGTGWAPG